MSHAHHSAAVYMHALEVEPEDIDFMGHVNNASYLRWIQDAVLAHWHRTAGSDAVAAHAWVALKHEITYRQPAFLNDKIIAVVTLEEVRRHSAFYRTIIKRGGKILASAKSRWCCLDRTTLRPTRLPSAVIERFFGDSNRSAVER